MRDTPEKMWNPRAQEVFVFGSNLAGRHGKGAARFAWERCGAVPGTGAGFSGRSYAIPTKDARLNVLPLPVIEKHVAQFLAFAGLHTDLIFWVTKIGCGLAHYRAPQIAGLFVGKTIPANVRLPKEFREHIELHQDCGQRPLPKNL